MASRCCVLPVPECEAEMQEFGGEEQKCENIPVLHDTTTYYRKFVFIFNTRISFFIY